MRSPLNVQQQDALNRMREILNENFVTLEVASYAVREDFAASRCAITATVLEQPSGSELEVSGEGVGTIDAFFGALRARYAAEHPSLGSLRFTRVGIQGLMNEARQGTGTDARAQAEIGITNSYGIEFLFGAVSASISRSSVEAVLSGVEFFVNSERAYVTAYRALDHAKRSHRPELVARYTDWLAHMVRNTSYSAVIERLQASGG